MSFGGKKPKKAKAHTYKSTYNGVYQSDASNPFATASSYKDGNRLVTDSSFVPELQRIQSEAQGGIDKNLSYLNSNPEQRVQYLRDGKDPYYNLARKSQDSALSESIGRAKLDAYKGGKQNSTAFGATLGRIIGDDVIRRNSLLNNSINFLDDRAAKVVGLGSGVLGQLNSFVSPLTQITNTGLLTSMNQQDAARARNAAALNQAELANTQAINQYNQQKSAGIGSAISGLMGLAPAAIMAMSGVPLPPSGGGYSGTPPIMPAQSYGGFGGIPVPESNMPYFGWGGRRLNAPTGDGSSILAAMGGNPFNGMEAMTL